MSEDYINYNYKMPAVKPKQTAVEWLIIQIKNDHIDKALTGLEWMKIFEQAKEMEKQQIIKAYMNVNDDRDYRLQDVILKEFAEQYYNKQYGGNNEQQ